MENLYLIQLTFYDGTDEISLWWLPSSHCFTFSQPRAVIAGVDLPTEASHAEQHARQVLTGKKFHLYTHDITAALPRAPIVGRREAGRA